MAKTLQYKASYIKTSPGGENYINFKSRTYKVKNFQDRKLNKGSNSAIFILTDPSEEFAEEKVIKICRYPLDSTQSREKRRIERFKREIRALKEATEQKCKSVIGYEDDSTIEISQKEFLCYIMEKGDKDLAEHLLDNYESVDSQTKFNFCINALYAIKELHGIGVYHRDIKPDNIFLIDKVLKIGDLGLIEYREEDYQIDRTREKIGSFGWLSPEVMNKALTEDRTYNFNFDYKIDAKSDIFQLGKLFWFIFQGNVPIGQIIGSDFISGQNEMLEIILQMIQYSKSRRIDIQKIEEKLADLYTKFGM